MNWRVSLLDGARREMRQTASAYEHEREGLGERFLDEVVAVRNQIAALPERFQPWLSIRTTGRQSWRCFRSWCSFESTNRVAPS
jgi:hypothetical protein